MSELKPCPFCGNKAVELMRFQESPHRITYLVRCVTLEDLAYDPDFDFDFPEPADNSCGYIESHGKQALKKDAINYWNTRPIEDKLKAEIANLHGVIDADDKRLLEAGQRVGIVSGCDNPDIMADEILTLRAEIDRLKAERRWIPVSERLPEEDDPACLFRTSGGGVYFGYRIGDIPCWVAVGIRDFIGLLYDTVTHWMPLPQPPSEEEC